MPARNEERLLAGSLRALAHQTGLDGRQRDPATFEVLLLLNNCDDDSVGVVRRFTRDHPRTTLHVITRTLPPEQAHIGWVRRALMDEACRRLWGIGRPQGIIASTDSDSHVASDWLAQTQREIERGADAVGGRIFVERPQRNAPASDARLLYLRDLAYHLRAAELEHRLDPDPADPWPRHHQHYGASLAVTAAMYRCAGGMPDVRRLEDLVFYERLLRADARVRHSPTVCVCTTARQAGRTEEGLATQLEDWAEDRRHGRSHLVESVPSIEARLNARRRLRRLWAAVRAGIAPPPGETDALASTLDITPGRLTDELCRPQTFGLLHERVANAQHGIDRWKRQWPLVPVEQAVADLNTRLRG